MFSPAAGNILIRIDHGNYNPLNAGLEYLAGTGGGAARMVTGLKRYVKGGIAGRISRRLNGIYFGMRPAGRFVVPLSQNPIVLYEHSPDHRIRRRIALSLLRKFKGQVHKISIIH